MKDPPITILFWSGERVIASTVPPALAGFHGRSEPSEALKAAKFARAAEPTPLNQPPAYTLVLVATIDLTMALTAGAKLVISAPEVGFSAAIL